MKSRCRTSADYLREIFNRLGDPSERGEDYRASASSWLDRRPAVRVKYLSDSFSAEIDQPYIGPKWHQRPAGGRIYGSFETWIELTPNEADEVENICRTATENALEEYLKSKNLLGKLRDTTGVATYGDFTNENYIPRDGDILSRPKNYEEFNENEARISRDVEREALNSTNHPTDEKSIIFYEGFWRTPSRCHVFHRKDGESVLFVFGCIPYGGTSPTNMIEELATQMRIRFYPDIAPEKIDWFDCHSSDLIYTSPKAEIVIHRVSLSNYSSGHYSDPKWSTAELPEDIKSEVEKALLTKKPHK